MSTGEPRGISLEELKDLARPAARVPELVAIARTALSNTEAKDRALEFTKEQGLDEAIAKSCRWLKILRDELTKKGRSEEFKIFIAENKEHLKERREKMDKGIRLNITNVKGIKTGLPIDAYGLEVELNFQDFNQAIKGIVAILDQLRGVSETDVLAKSHEEISLRDMLIWILEKKYGMKVKVCGNCKYFQDKVHLEGSRFEIGGCKRELQNKHQLAGYRESCHHWAPKEVSQKVEADSPS